MRKKEVMKKVWSILLALVLVLGNFPAPVHAHAQELEHGEGVVETTAPVESVAPVTTAPETDEAVAALQALIDALPDSVTAENAGDVAAELSAIDAAKLALTEAQLAQVDFARYVAAAAALGSVYDTAPAETEYAGGIAGSGEGTGSTDTSTTDPGTNPGGILGSGEDTGTTDPGTTTDPSATDPGTNPGGITGSGEGGEISDASNSSVYMVSIAETTNGTVTADVESAAEGTTVTLAVTPDDGCELETLTVTDGAGNSVTVSENTFIMPGSEVTVSATFKANGPATITGVSLTVDDTTYTGAQGEGVAYITPESQITLTITGVNLKNMTMENHVHGQTVFFGHSSEWVFKEDGTEASIASPPDEWRAESEEIGSLWYTNDDINFSDTNIYVTYLTSAGTDLTTIYFRNSVGWETVYAKFYTAKDTYGNGDYDGGYALTDVEMKPVAEGSTVYAASSIPKNAAKVVFSDGSDSTDMVELPMASAKTSCYDSGTWVHYHDGEVTYAVNNDDSTVHNAVYSCCGESTTEPHTYAPATGTCVCSAQAEAKVGDTVYVTLAEALSAAQGSEGATLTLLADVDGDYTVNSGTFTLDLNGKTITGTGKTIDVDTAANLTITDSSEAGNGTISGYENGVYNSGTVTVNGGTLTGRRGVRNDGTVTVTGGTITGNEYGVDNYGTVTVNSGTITCTANGVCNYGTATINGGTIDASTDFYIGTDAITTTVTGGTFPGGISVSGGTLNDLLGTERAYYIGTELQTPADDATELTGGDVTVQTCNHSKGTYTDNGDGKHTVTCPACGKEETAAHDAFTESQDGKKAICACGAEATFSVMSGSETKYYTSTSDSDLEYAITEGAYAKLYADLYSWQLSPYYGCTLDLNGYTITIENNAILSNVNTMRNGTICSLNTASDGFVLGVEDASVTLEDITISGESVGYGVWVSSYMSGGELIIGENCVIGGNKASINVDMGSVSMKAAPADGTTYSVYMDEPGSFTRYNNNMSGYGKYFTSAVQGYVVTAHNDYLSLSPCDHSGDDGKNCRDNGNGTHTRVCSACGKEETAAHDAFTESEDGKKAICACGVEATFSVMSGSETTYYMGTSRDDLQDAITADSVVKLYTDLSLNYQFSIYDNCTLDLNGYTITGSELYVGMSVECTIQNGTISSTASSRYSCAISVSEAYVTLENITVKGNNAGFGVTVSMGVFTIGKNCAISGKTASIYAVNGGAVSMMAAPAAGTTYSVYMDDPGTFTYYGMGGYKQYFTSAVPGYVVTESDGYLSLSACDHTGGTFTYRDNENGTHTAVCSICGGDAGTANHTYNAAGTCTVCKAQAQAKVGEDFYLTLTDAITAAQGIENSTLTLLADVTGDYTVASGAFSLDLNGKTITGNDTAITVQAEADLHITDSSVAQNGRITGPKYGVFNYGALYVRTVTIESDECGVYNTGGLTVRDATIIGGREGVGNERYMEMSGGTVRADAQGGKGVINYSGADLDVHDGTISGYENGVYNSGTVIVYGGTIKATGSNGRGVNNLYDANLTVAGGTITGEEYGVYNYETVTVTGGTIQATGSGGIGVSNISGAELTVNSGTVTGTDFGVNNLGTVTVNSGTIQATDSGGISVCNGSTGKMIMEDGTITGTYALDNNGTLTVAGGTITAVGVAVTSAGTVNITGGTINASTDFAIGGGTTTLTGGTFPDGISVTGGTSVTLKSLLGTGCAYYIGDDLQTPAAEDTKLTGGDVTVQTCGHDKAACTDNGDGTHTVTCAGCGQVQGEPQPHSYTNGTCADCGYVLTYTVTLNGAGGTLNGEGEVELTLGYPWELKLSDHAFTREGYTLNGWTDGSGTGYDAEDTVKVEGDMSLEAQWQINTYNVNWQVSGETVYTSQVQYGGTITPPGSGDVTIPEGYYSVEWDSYPATMGAEDVTVKDGYWTVYLAIDDEDYPFFKQCKVGDTVYAKYNGKYYKEGHTFYLASQDETELYEVT